MNTRIPLKERFWKYVNIAAEDQCWLWTGATLKSGYGIIGGDRTDAGQKTLRAHRVAYALQKGPIPEGLGILHSCDNPLCMNGAHLRPGTQLQNMQDRAVRGRGNHRSGERHYKSRLTIEDVIAIRASNEKQRVLAERYQTHQTNISDIKLRKVWKSVP